MGYLHGNHVIVAGIRCDFRQHYLELSNGFHAAAHTTHASRNLRIIAFSYWGRKGFKLKEDLNWYGFYSEPFFGTHSSMDGKFL